MSDKLLQYYEKELAFLQLSAGEFARKHPGAASGLQLSEDTVSDPLVSQLLSGVAYMNARIHQKLDDELPELSDSLLDTLYPHYLRPIPSMAMVQCPPLEDLDKLHRIHRGTQIQTTSDLHDNCTFTLCSTINMAPLKVSSVKLVQKPFIAPGSASATNADAVLKVNLQTLSDAITFDETGIDSLRFFLKGPKQHTYPLYDLLLAECEAIFVATSDTDPSPIRIPVSCLKPVGFDEDDALLPYPDTAFTGYRLLTEYFAFPEKFLSLDIVQLTQAVQNTNGCKLNLYFYLRRHNTELEHQVSADMFALNCAPAINLFPQTCDPIRLSQTDYLYPIEPDARRHKSLEVYSIDSINGIDDKGKKTPYLQFYGANHKSPSSDSSAFWFSKRRDVTEGEHANEHASEVDIGIVDLNFEPFHVANQVLEIKAHCSNRNLPKKLPTSNGQPHFHLVEGDAPTEGFRCVVVPTEAMRIAQGKNAYWRLISHLNLNHLSITQGASSRDALKEILRLYNFKNSASTRNHIESIQNIKTRAITAPIQVDGTIALCRGTEITITLDTLMLNGASIMVFSNLLNHFFGLYCSINSFTKLSIKLSGKDGVYYKWPPRAGEKALV